MLNRLEKGGLVTRNKEVSLRDNKVNVNASYIWSVKPSSLDEEQFSRDKRIPIDADNRDHELDCADFLVALLISLYPEQHRLSHWDYSWSKTERADFRIDEHKVDGKSYKGYGVNFDRRFMLDLSENADKSDRRLHFLEVDRGTKDPDKVYQQFARYQRFFDQMANNDEMLLVTAQRYRFRTDEDRKQDLLTLLAKAQLGSRAAVALHKDALVNPMSRVWFRSDDPKNARTLAEL